MVRIVVVGIGGVGGYFGGLLAKCYQGSEDVHVIFISRGEHLKQIQTKGLRVIKGETEFNAVPYLITDNPKEIEKADFIIVCTKSYDLEDTIEQLKPYIDQQTILLPLLNGVDGVERIKKLLPDNTIYNGCVYIVSKIKEPGVVENLGNMQKLYFGLDGETNDKLLQLESILLGASIEAYRSEQISSIVWEKFIFISATATATSYYNEPIGKLLKERQEIVLKLLSEVTSLALAKGIQVDSNIIEKNLNILKALPYETTSSMQRDFISGKGKTELESLCGYVVREGEKFKVNIPTFREIYNDLQIK